jgi:MtN3 and saliva related transmembrane protein
MFTVLAAGVALWIAYGFLKSDLVIVFANTVSLVLLIGILYFKLRASKADPA